MADLFKLRGAAIADDARVVSVQGTEGISSLYQFRIGLLVKGAPIDLDTAMRSRVCLDVRSSNPEGVGQQRYHGIVAAVEHIYQFEDEALYQLLLVPKLWNLTQTRHSRVFTDQTVPQIIESILLASDMVPDDFTIKTLKPYPVRDFVCQYKESNYAFISRWMEREGMYFYFKQGEKYEQLAIIDNKSIFYQKEADPVRYLHMAEGDRSAGEGFESFICRRVAQPQRVELRDYNYLQPTTPLLVREQVAADGLGEISSFGENFRTEADGKRLATLRAQELSVRQSVSRGRGRVFNLSARQRIKLTDHPVESFNTEYLVTDVKHFSNQALNDPRLMRLLGVEGNDDYLVEVAVVLDKSQYRSADRFPWPRIDSFEAAVICSETDGAQAALDDHGRYLVRIKFDESDLKDGRASARVRMMQPHGGKNEGFHSPLHQDTEVALLFLGGDPDRPVIAGVLPNAVTQSPVDVDCPGTHIWITRYSNYFKMVDDRDSLGIKIYSPKYETHLHLGDVNTEWGFELYTEFHAHFYVLNNWVVDIDGETTFNVKLDVAFNFDLNFRLTVLAAMYVDVTANLEIKVDADVKIEVTNEWRQVVHNNMWLTVDVDYTQVVKNHYQLQVYKEYNLFVHQSVFWQVDQDITILTAKVLRLEALVAKLEINNTMIVLDTGAGAKIALSSGDIVIDCNSLTIKAKTFIKAKANTRLELEGVAGAKLSSASITDVEGALVNASGARVSLNP